MEKWNLNFSLEWLYSKHVFVRLCLFCDRVDTYMWTPRPCLIYFSKCTSHSESRIKLDESIGRPILTNRSYCCTNEKKNNPDKIQLVSFTARYLIEIMGNMYGTCFLFVLTCILSSGLYFLFGHHLLGYNMLFWDLCIIGASHIVIVSVTHGLTAYFIQLCRCALIDMKSWAVVSVTLASSTLPPFFASPAFSLNTSPYRSPSARQIESRLTAVSRYPRIIPVCQVSRQGVAFYILGGWFWSALICGRTLGWGRSLTIYSGHSQAGFSHKTLSSACDSQKSPEQFPVHWVSKAFYPGNPSF